MIKRFCIVFALLILLISPLTAYADVVFGNDFFYENQENTKEINTRFIVNSPLGYVIPEEEPGSQGGISTEWGYRSGWGDEDMKEQSGPVFVFQNGEIVIIDAILLHNGEYWGVMSPSHQIQPPGWIPMDELLIMYDHSDFEWENQRNFYQYTGRYDAVLKATKLVLWEWPGSDRERRIIEDKNTISKLANVLYAYQDKDGREWGKTSHLEGWICLSDPENNEIPAFYLGSEATKWFPETSDEQPIQGFRNTLRKLMQTL